MAKKKTTKPKKPKKGRGVVGDDTVPPKGAYGGKKPPKSTRR